MRSQSDVCCNYIVVLEFIVFPRVKPSSGGSEFGLETTGILHPRPLSRGVRAPVALLTLPSVGRCGAVFAFASWADGTIVKLPTRILLKSPLFVLVSLRSFSKRALCVTCDFEAWVCRCGSAAAGRRGRKACFPRKRSLKGGPPFCGPSTVYLKMALAAFCI